MGVVISKPAINIREQLTELKAQQGYEERQFHFDNLVTNGTFDTDTTGWAPAVATLSVVSNRLRVTNTGAGYGLAYQSFTTVVGKVYVVSVEFTAGTAATGKFGIGTTATGEEIGATALDATSTKTLTFTATSTTTWIDVVIQNAGTSTYADFDNISVYEADPVDDKVIHTMPKGWKPLHVFEDGALQREGSAYDYTVEYDGFNYIIKETVAPVAPYSTTVIGVRA